MYIKLCNLKVCPDWRFQRWDVPGVIFPFRASSREVARCISKMVEVSPGDQTNPEQTTHLSTVIASETDRLLGQFVKGNDESRLFDGLEKVVESIDKCASIDGRLHNKYPYLTNSNLPMDTNSTCSITGTTVASSGLTHALYLIGTSSLQQIY